MRIITDTKLISRRRVRYDLNDVIYESRDIISGFDRR